MTKLLSLSRSMTTAVVALALVAGTSVTSRADIAYGFARQTITGVTITPTTTATSGVTTFTQDGSTVNGSGPANSNPLDAIQAYQGGGPAAPQNFFARYAPGNPPVSPVGNFTRGDAAIPVVSGANNSASTVAESFLNANTAMTETGSGGLGASFSFTVPTATALTIAYNFANDIFVFTSGAAATASASYSFNITIRESSTGGIVFSSSTAETNLSVVAPPPGNQISRSGSQSVLTPLLQAGTGYTFIFSSTAQSAVAVVPEPASIALLGLGGLGIGLIARRRMSRASV